jgi:hypothetical protein
MKKILMVLIGLSLIFVLNGCVATNTYYDQYGNPTYTSQIAVAPPVVAGVGYGYPVYVDPPTTWVRIPADNYGPRCGVRYYRY